ncbi:MAG: NUDIX hydrolase [uncultured bacterium (gcode 4)]|uniref:NUDIX hydrolase n=1 Tax=uncultured bacterium (gcode 4) TaxID=1234023 RepID=K1YBS6_9BACT|nr:MAG: NUDIX hydrolase [uncultured bacterium (gcode 4)]
MEPIYVIGLTRVSSENQGKFWDSPEVQEQAIKRTAEGKGETLLMTFKENYTGTKMNRPAVLKALEFIKLSKVKISKCYIYNIDRSSRGWHDVHFWIKKMFKDVWVTYLDTSWVMQEKRKIIHIEWVNTDEYGWAYENPSEYAEEMLVMMAKNEKDKMLQRTISQEIRNTKDGYHQRESHFGLKNMRIQTTEWKKKVIEIPDDGMEGEWMRKIYELRSIGIPDTEIVKEVNLMGFKTRYNKCGDIETIGSPLTVKYLQKLVKNPTYAWVKIEKWTGNKPVRVPYVDGYQSLVSITTWNRANKWVVQIAEREDGEVEILYSKKWKESFEPIVERRKNYDSNYPFTRALRCPTCSGHLTPSKSRSKTWAHHYYYQCNGKKNENWIIKHPNYSLRRTEANSKVMEFMREITPSPWLIKSIDYIASVYFDSRNKSNIHVVSENEKKLKEYENQKRELGGSIHKYLHLPNTIEAIEKQLGKIDEDILQLKTISADLVCGQGVNKTEFRKFMVYHLTHLQELASDVEKPENIDLIFRFVFQEKPSYEEILSHTPKIYPIFSLQSQLKNPPEGDFSESMHWWRHGESNSDCGNENPAS